MKILCTLCMRGNSQGIKNKNIISFFGKPLFYYSLINAKKFKKFDEIVVSSDSKKILKICKKYGVKNLVHRPKILSNHKSGKIPAIKHATIAIEKKLNKKFDMVVDLDVTCPLRTVSDIQKAIKKIVKDGSCNLVSATYSRKNPYFNIVQKKNKTIRLVKKHNKNFLRRQDTPITFDLNASIYIWKRDFLIKNPSIFQKKTSIYIMSKSKSFDIDDLDDLEINKLFFKRKKF